MQEAGPLLTSKQANKQSSSQAVKQSMETVKPALAISTPGAISSEEILERWWRRNSR